MSTELTGGSTPADGGDPRTFPAIYNAEAVAHDGTLAEGDLVRVKSLPGDGPLVLEPAEGGDGSSDTVFYGDDESTPRPRQGGAPVVWVGFEGYVPAEAEDELDIIYTFSNAASDPWFVSWYAAYWADELELSNGDTVDAWADGSGNGQGLALEGGAPEYVAEDSLFGGKPSVLFPGQSDALTVTFGAPLDQPNEVFIVLQVPELVDDQRIAFDGVADGERNLFFRNAGSGGLSIFAGSISSGEHLQSTAAFRANVLFDGTGSFIDTDEVSAFDLDAGDQPSGGLTVGSRYTIEDGLDGGRIAFLGIVDGVLSEQERQDLVAWAQSHYGVS